MEFNSIYFHDAELKEINYEWNSKTLVLKLNIFIEGPGNTYRQSDLRFLDCTYFEVPHNAPWGESLYVNGAIQIHISNIKHKYEIEMISGDMIRIEAKTFELLSE